MRLPLKLKTHPELQPDMNDTPNARLHIVESHDYSDDFLTSTLCDECTQPLLSDKSDFPFLIIEPIVPHHKTSEMRQIHAECFIPPVEFEKSNEKGLPDLLHSLFGWDSLSVQSMKNVEKIFREILAEQSTRRKQPCQTIEENFPIPSAFHEIVSKSYYQTGEYIVSSFSHNWCYIPIL